MSAGSSSHDVACFSVDRTKYLMLSKSMPDRSEPQVGIGFLPNSRRPLSRSLSIHSGSLLSAEMSRTTASDRPRWATGAGDVGVGPAEGIAAQAVELGVGGLGDGRHWAVLRVVGLGRSVDLGTYVVQTPSPCAMVASRWTWVPSRRAKTSVSASHSSGNCSATWATGQWCWQSCSPVAGRGRLGRGSVAVGREGVGEGLGPVPGGGRSTIGRYRASSSATRWRANAATAGRATLLLDEAQRAGRKVVVGLVEGVPADRGHREQPRRAAAAPGGGGPRLALLDQPLREQRVQVAAHGGGGQPEVLGQQGGGGGTGLEDGAGDPVAGRVLEVGFHNTSVALFGTDRKRRGGRCVGCHSGAAHHTVRVSDTILTRRDVAQGLRALGRQHRRPPPRPQLGQGPGLDSRRPGGDRAGAARRRRGGRNPRGADPDQREQRPRRLGAPPGPAELVGR